MGLFAPSPEEPTEWAGLPSEPLEPRSAADRLSTDGSVDVLGLLAGTGVASIPLAVGDGTAPAAPVDSEPAAGPAPEGDAPGSRHL